MDRKLVRALRKVLNIVRNFAANETQLRGFGGLNFEKLSGSRSHQHSLRLNVQWRLIVEIVERPGQNNNVCLVKAIENHYR